MKSITFPLIALMLVASVQAKPFGKGKGRGPIHHGNGKEKVAENAAMREEQVLDHLDTHKWKKDPEATDKRPTGLAEYHNRTLKRIVALLRHGAITEENGTLFKTEHTKITLHGKELKADGEMTEEEATTLRRELHALNDSINDSLLAAEEGANRTPLLNQTQHRFEEQIEFGIRSGRLSTGEANRLKRKVESLKRLEEREKAGGLSTKDREKLFEEAAEISRDIRKDLTD